MELMKNTSSSKISPKKLALKGYSKLENVVKLLNFFQIVPRSVGWPCEQYLSNGLFQEVCNAFEKVHSILNKFSKKFTIQSKT